MMRLFTAACFGLILAGCAQPAPERETLRVCSTDGCVERPRDAASHDPSATVPEADPEGRLASLEALARENPAAAYDLGLRYFRGDGVRQDSYQALQWMRDAAERGDMEAQKALGRLYLTGLEEMGADPREARRWLARAAERGDGESQALLAEAEQALEDEQSYAEKRRQWHPRVRGYWYRNAPYSGHWRDGGWRYPDSPKRY